MSQKQKNKAAILQKLGIDALNSMQEETQLAIHSSPEVILLSPTGTGKTLAFLLPIVAELDNQMDAVQALIIVPSRELAIQIEQVARDMGAGFKIEAVYGGRTVSKDKLNLVHPPAILIGTPGRVAHHLRKKSFLVDHIHYLVLDEFDKSLEIGFEEEMQAIITGLPNIKKKILTSATQQANIPGFVELNAPLLIDHLDEGVRELQMKAIISPEKDKLETLFRALCHLGNQPGLIFCNYKDSIERVSNYLSERKIAHGIYHGGLEQIDRERALIQFRNGTHQLIIATDLAARGLDIPEIQFIIHYHLPNRAEEFTHRNGRTARMHNKGTAYVLHWQDDELPDFIPELEAEEIAEAPIPSSSPWATLFISGGRKDKISKGDIAGLFFKQGELKKDELGVIELKKDCAFVAVKKDRVKHVLKFVDQQRLKKKKVRVRAV